MSEQQNKSNTPKKSNNQQPKRSRWSWLYYIVMIGLLFFFFFPFGDAKNADKNLSYTKFTAYIENDAIASVTVYDDNTAKAKIRPEKYAIVFSNQEAGEDGHYRHPGGFHHLLPGNCLLSEEAPCGQDSLCVRHQVLDPGAGNGGLQDHHQPG